MVYVDVAHEMSLTPPQQPTSSMRPMQDEKDTLRQRETHMRQLRAPGAGVSVVWTRQEVQPDHVAAGLTLEALAKHLPRSRHVWGRRD